MLKLEVDVIAYHPWIFSTSYNQGRVSCWIRSSLFKLVWLARLLKRFPIFTFQNWSEETNNDTSFWSGKQPIRHCNPKLLYNKLGHTQFHKKKRNHPIRHSLNPTHYVSNFDNWLSPMYRKVIKQKIIRKTLELSDIRD